MRTRAGEESIKHRGDEASRTDGLDSLNGGGLSNGGITEAPLLSFGTGRAGREREDAVSEKTWFDPVDELVISDCPGGVCPVPWAIETDPNSVFTFDGPPVIKEDEVNHPSHYVETGGVECIEAIEAQLTTEEYEGYLRGNCVKYLWRWKNKGGVQDLKKCKWYLERLIEINDSE